MSTALSSGNSSPNPAKSHRTNFSIDDSLELEHQLNAEVDSEPRHSMDEQAAAPDALDPHILASLISQLRFSLSEMTKERDELVQLLAKSQASEATLSDALQNMTDKATELRDELSSAQQKAKDDEDAISMLRTKVEESRRGLMRLQSENRRQSMQPIDVSRASQAGMAGISTAPSSMASKRASFTPLTGQTITMPAENTSSPPKSRHARRISDIFSVGALGGSPPLPTPSPPRPDVNPELETLRKEISSLKDALEETRNELTESHEARDASDTCVTALRAFIDENNIGVNPPPRTSTDSATSSATSATSSSSAKAPSSWGFNKLWKVDTAAAKANVSPSEATPTGPTSTTQRKFGSLFSSRTPSVASASVPVEQSVTSDSDASSVVEPVSPVASAGDNSGVVVRELSDSGSPLTPSVESGAGVEQKVVV